MLVRLDAVLHVLKHVEDIALRGVAVDVIVDVLDAMEHLDIPLEDVDVLDVLDRVQLDALLTVKDVVVVLEDALDLALEDVDLVAQDADLAVVHHAVDVQAVKMDALEGVKDVLDLVEDLAQQVADLTAHQIVQQDVKIVAVRPVHQHVILIVQEHVLDKLLNY